MKLSLALFGIAVADLLPSPGAPCPKITCVMFCKDGMQKDAKGCDICSCARDGKVASGTASCKRDADGCCSELGVAWCADQNMCVSTHGAVIPCKSWANNVPAAAANAQITVLRAGEIQSTTFGNSPIQTSASTPNSYASSFSGVVQPNFNTQFSSSFSAVQPSVPPITQPSYSSTFSTSNPGTSSLTFSSSNPPAVDASAWTTGTFAASGNSANGAVSADFAGNAALTTRSAASSCSPVMCAMYCPNGFQKDANGCDRCSCAGATSSACPSTADCAGRACAGGYAKDNKGCPTCICLSGSATPVTTSSTAGIARSSTPQIEAAPAAAVHSDALVALDRPTISLNPCLPAPGPCQRNQRCVPTPKQCVTTPCPQYSCVNRPMKGGKKGRRP